MNYRATLDSMNQSEASRIRAESDEKMYMSITGTESWMGYAAAMGIFRLRPEEGTARLLVMKRDESARIPLTLYAFPDYTLPEPDISPIQKMRYTDVFDVDKLLSFKRRYGPAADMSNTMAAIRTVQKIIKTERNLNRLKAELEYDETLKCIRCLYYQLEFVSAPGPSPTWIVCSSFTFEPGFMKTEEGKKMYWKNLQMISDMLVETTEYVASLPFDQLSHVERVQLLEDERIKLLADTKTE